MPSVPTEDLLLSKNAFYFMVCTSLNRDCWYFYTLDPLGPKQLDLDTEEDPADQTIEILMQDLDPQVMALFNKVSAMGDPKQATQVIGQSKGHQTLVL